MGDKRILNLCALSNAKECSNYHTIALISHTSKVMLKILQARLQQYVNCELPDVQASFRKGRGTRDQIANIRWIIEKAKEFQKNIYFCFMPKPLTVWITTVFKKIRDTKGTFNANMGTIKGRNAMDLTEADDIRKRWQEYTEELYK